LPSSPKPPSCFFQPYAHPPDLPSFPTRRSSDLLHRHAVALPVEAPRAEVLTQHPAGDREAHAVQDDARTVLVLESVLEHVELEGAHHAHDGILHAHGELLEELHRALFGELLEPLLHLLALEGILGADHREVLGAEAGHALEGVATLAEGVADAELPGVEEADDISGPGVLDLGALGGEKLAGLGEAHVLAEPRMPRAHPLGVLATDHAQERDAVAVGGIHVRLDLEDEASELRLGGLVDAVIRHACGGRGRELQEAVEEGAHAEVGHGAAEVHGADLPAVALLAGELVPADVEQLDVLVELRELRLGEEGGDLGIVDGDAALGNLALTVSALGVEEVHDLLLPVVDAAELLAH